MRDERIQLVHQLVVAIVQLHQRSGSHVRRKGHSALRRDDVRIRSQQEQVAARLDGREPGARNHHSAGAGEALDGGAHGGL